MGEVGETLLLVFLIILGMCHQPWDDSTKRFADTLCYSIIFSIPHCIYQGNDLQMTCIFRHSLQQYFPAAGSASTVHVVQPNSLWTAGCCVTISTTTGAITTAESIAVIGNNDRNSSCTLTGRVDLRDLERLIVSNTSTPANIFPGFPDGCRNNSYSANL